MTNCNKQNLINTVAERTGVSKKDTSVIVDTMLDIIKETLASGVGVDIYGFGKLEVKDVAARDGVTQLGENKGQPWHKDASKTVRFKVAKALKSIVNE